jgi:Avidin family
MRRILLVLLLVTGSAPTAIAQSLPEWSIWKNQRTSLLIVTKVSADIFMGTFINNAQGFKCQGVAVPIAGKSTGDKVTFVANFAPCSNTITAWKGTLSGNTITADWDLWYADDDGNFHEDKSQDTFTKIN